MVDVKAGKLYTKATYVKNLDLTSQVDGIIDTFTVPAAYVADHLEVFKNGLNQVDDFIELSDTQFQLTNVPLVGDKITINFLKK